MRRKTIQTLGFGIMAVAFALLAFIPNLEKMNLAMLPETKGKSLEEISSEPESAAGTADCIVTFGLETRSVISTAGGAGAERSLYLLPACCMFSWSSVRNTGVSPLRRR